MFSFPLFFSDSHLSLIMWNRKPSRISKYFSPPFYFVLFHFVSILFVTKMLKYFNWMKGKRIHWTYSILWSLLSTQRECSIFDISLQSFWIHAYAIKFYVEMTLVLKLQYFPPNWRIRRILVIKTESLRGEFHFMLWLHSIDFILQNSENNLKSKLYFISFFGCYGRSILLIIRFISIFHNCVTNNRVTNSDDASKLNRFDSSDNPFFPFLFLNKRNCPYSAHRLIKYKSCF